MKRQKTSPPPHPHYNNNPKPREGHLYCCMGRMNCCMSSALMPRVPAERSEEAEDPAFLPPACSPVAPTRLARLINAHGQLRSVCSGLHLGDRSPQLHVCPPRGGVLLPRGGRAAAAQFACCCVRCAQAALGGHCEGTSRDQGADTRRRRGAGDACVRSRLSPPNAGEQRECHRDHKGRPRQLRHEGERGRPAARSRRAALILQSKCVRAPRAARRSRVLAIDWSLGAWHLLRLPAGARSLL